MGSAAHVMDFGNVIERSGTAIFHGSTHPGKDAFEMKMLTGHELRQLV